MSVRKYRAVATYANGSTSSASLRAYDINDAYGAVSRMYPNASHYFVEPATIFAPPVPPVSEQAEPPAPPAVESKATPADATGVDGGAACFHRPPVSEVCGGERSSGLTVILPVPEKAPGRDEAAMRESRKATLAPSEIGKHESPDPQQSGSGSGRVAAACRAESAAEYRARLGLPTPNSDIARDLSNQLTQVAWSTTITREALGLELLRIANALHTESKRLRAPAEGSPELSHRERGFDPEAARRAEGRTIP